MSVIKRGEAPAPVLPKETVAVEALGGEVVVRGMLLTERLALQTRLADHTADGDRSLALQALVPRVLACAVRDAEGEPVYTEPQWEAFGAAHSTAALQLFAVAMRLSGFHGEALAKN